MELAVTDGQEVRADMCFYLRDENDENRFRNLYVNQRKAAKALLVPFVNKRNRGGYQRKN